MSIPSSILVRCPNCQREAQVDNALRGTSVRCTTCAHVFMIPTAEPSPVIAMPVAPPSNTYTPAAAPSYQAPVPAATPAAGTTAVGTYVAPSYQANQPAPEPRPSSLSLPLNIPISLRLSERLLQLLSALIGIPLGAAGSLLIALLGQNTMAGKIFNLHSISAVIPVAIMCMFFWGVMLCVFRLFRVTALEKTMRKMTLLNVVSALQTDGIEAQAKLLSAHPLCDVHPLYRRLRAIVVQWLRKPSLQDADILLQKHEAGDEDGVHAGYTLVRTFIWSMPVLGLIGTVIGISLAVGGFASFLGGNVEDVVKIKTSLVGVTSGLSFAFLITLEGLLGALLTMLPASALQAREEQLNTSIQRFLTDLYLPMLGTVAPESRRKSDEGGLPSGELLETWREALKEVSTEVLLAVRDTAKTVLNDLSDYRQAQRLEAEEWVTKLGGMIAQITEQFATSTNDFLTRLDLLRETMAQDRAHFQATQQQALQAESAQHQEVIAAMSAHNTALRQASDVVGQLVTITANALQLQESLMSSVAQLGQLNLSDLSEVIADYTRTLQEAETRMADFTGNIGEILTAQNSLQGAVVQLQDLNFIATLSQFRETLSRLTPLLNMLVNPRIVLMSTPTGEITPG